MRIISQNGIYDIPYKKSVIERDEITISAKVVDGTRYIIAGYSSEEKADKAMEMCRKAHMECEIAERTMGLTSYLIGLTGKAEGVLEPVLTQLAAQTIFQFPKDEEVVV